MKLKYYLRGLGIGIIIAVVIMIIAFRIHGSEMSDQQVIERAQELGMVIPENGAVADLRDKQQAEEKENAADDGGTDADQNDAGNKDKPGDNNTDAGNNAAGNDGSDAENAAEVKSNTNDDSNADASQAGQYVTFIVSGGEYSDKISQNLQTSGLIDDAESFNKWLQETDYDNFIQPGTFQIPVGSTWDEIAVILTTKEENQGQPQSTQPVQP
ncbi:MAG: hypothetical protein HFG80_06215 [Eubacterium sp.]|nr:hypothetical protein [Eubacterium sp.]